MSFLGTVGKSFAKETREEQFLRYFRDTGASKAFQNALILLYKMPIKPTNLVEFFAEYFENGAQDLVKLSLLRAELCYKHVETKDMHKRIATLEKELQKYEPLASERSSRYFEERERFSILTDAGENEHLQNGESYDVFNRFFGDIDKAKRGSVPESAEPSIANVYSQTQLDMQDEPDDAYWSKSHLRHMSEDDGMETINDELDVPEVKCVQEQDSQKAFLKDIKILDPWGIICNFQPYKEENPNVENKAKKTKAHKEGQTTPPDLSLIGSVSSLDDSEKNYKNYDSDDAETLAEMYHNLASDAAKEASAERNEVQASTSDIKLLSVQNAPKISMGDLLGWSPLPSSTTLNKPQAWRPYGETSSNDLFQKEQTAPIKSRHWSDFIDPAKDDELETCEVERQHDVFWLDSPRGISTRLGNPMDDTYLLQQGMARIAKKMERSKDDGEGFIYQFIHQMESQNLEKYDNLVDACAQACHVYKRKESVAKVDAEMMTEVIDPCLCEDCNCDLGEEDGRRGSKFGPNIPGKMTNWTKSFNPEDPEEDYECYPGEDYELLGEDENLICYKRRTFDSEAERSKKASLEEESRSLQLLEDFTISQPPASVRSSCQCSDTSLVSLVPAKEECMRSCMAKKDGRKSVRNTRKSLFKDVKTMTTSEAQRRAEMEKEMGQSADPHLADIFKSPNPYGGQDDDVKSQGDINQKRSYGSRYKNKHRPTVEMKQSKIVVQGEEKYVSDAYELNLQNEIRKKFSMI